MTFFPGGYQFAIDLPTPALVFFPEIIQKNIARVVDMAGSPDRLRPHAKTHKTIEITKRQLMAGVTKHKCATITEADMLAKAGVPDVVFAYPAIGPNARHLARLAREYPQTFFSSAVDSEIGAHELDQAAQAAGVTLGFLVDVDVGQHRTGIDPLMAVARYQSFSRMTLVPNGLHVYDGHNNAESRADRDAIAKQTVVIATTLRKEIQSLGLPCPRIVIGGTPGFPSYAAMTDVPDLEYSPGTYVLHDHGYGSKYPDLTGVHPAAVVLTRVISKPGSNRITFDCGTKAIASDPPAGKRLIILDDPLLVPVGHNEEHYIVESANSGRWTIGDIATAIPTHICPTVALHREAVIVESGRIAGTWRIAARDRVGIS
jgi:D-threonine aldolase